MRASLGPMLATLALGASAGAAIAEEAAHRVGEADAPSPQDWRAADAAPAYDTAGGGEELAPASAAPEEANRTLRIPAATAYAAPLTASQDTCMGSRSFGVQSLRFGVSFATTWRDRSCRRIRNARELLALGYPEAARQLLCLEEEVSEAMERAGAPCPRVGLVQLTPEPLPEPEPEPAPLISFDDVLFDFDRATLRPEADAILEPLLAMLQADPAMSIDIEGHTDWIGSDAYNQGLSQRRAQAVVDWLVARGVDRARISAVGRGESEPVASNETAAGRQLNRRVEIRRREEM